MAIVNRDLDASEQRKAFVQTFGAVATGITLPVLAVPYPSTLDGIAVSAHGLSGTPTLAFSILRFIVGTGVTTITAGFTTLTPLAYSTSGLASVVQVAAGNTLLNLQANDIICATSAGSNAALKSLGVAVVLKATQDVKTTFGF